MGQKKSLYILGINLSHDRSACLLKDGRILTAIAEERLDRDKHSLGFMTVGKNAVSYRIPPLRSITYCLRAAGIGLDDLALIVADQPLLPLPEGFLNDFLPIQDKSKIRRLPHPSHHLAHAYSTYFCSPFQESAILIADAFGSELILGNEGESGYVARGNDVRMVFRTVQDSLPGKARPGRSSYALTVMYRLITQALGFVLPYGSWRPEAYFDEAGKTMGLAPYGRLIKSWPSLVEPANGTYRTDRFTRWIQDQKIGRLEKGELVAIIREHSQKLSRFHKDLAYKAQMELEQGLLLLAQKLHDETKCENLCLAGGAGLNCVANRKIFDHTPFKHIFVQPASTDDGNAIGCALYGWHKIIDREKRFVLRNVFLGREYKPEETTAALQKLKIRKKPLSKHELIRRTAEYIAEGKIVGWFQGGSEFGPRALGHRSILADPRRPSMKGQLNRKVKHRESFQPYAASILGKSASQCFDLPCTSPFMLLVGKVKNNWRKKIPAVVHVDGTSRIQTVTKGANPLFYELIREFYRLTKIPLILNTSLNRRGEPIVESPEDALNVFLGSKMDVLVLGNYLITKRGKEEIEGIKGIARTERIVASALKFVRGKK